MRIALSSRGPESGSRLESHFGHARWFLVDETASGTWSAVKNDPPTGGGHGAGLAVARRIQGLDVQVVVTGRMGSHPREILSSAGIALKQAGNTTVAGR